MKTKLKKILKDEKLRNEFYNHVKTEKAEENLEIYNQILEYSKIKDIELKKLKLKYIQIYFLENGSPKELNLSYEEKLKFKNYIFENNFEELEKTLIELLFDSFLRFSNKKEKTNRIEMNLFQKRERKSNLIENTQLKIDLKF